ncbi:MAG: HK97 gp10 family phage protein [Oscillospiraceae bacterium]|nr:HK97 gp10 family phage protein [Oscillospiraceae bacterium]
MGLNTEPMMEIALEKGAKKLQSYIKPLVPVAQIGGGELRNSISVEKSGRLAYSVGTNKKYAVYVEYGTGKLGDPTVPHTPKDKWVYFNDDLNQFITTEGQPAQHFMHQGLEDGKDAVIKEVEKEIRKWLT